MGWDEAHGSPGSRRRRRVPKGTSCARARVYRWETGLLRQERGGFVSWKFPGALAGDRACTLVAQRPSRVLFLVQCFLRRSHLRLNRSLRDTIVTTRTDADGTSSRTHRRRGASSPRSRSSIRSGKFGLNMCLSNICTRSRITGDHRAHPRPSGPPESGGDARPDHLETGPTQRPHLDHTDLTRTRRARSARARGAPAQQRPLRRCPAWSSARRRCTQTRSAAAPCALSLSSLHMWGEPRTAQASSRATSSRVLRARMPFFFSACHRNTLLLDAHHGAHTRAAATGAAASATPRQPRATRGVMAGGAMVADGGAACEWAPW
jgi:hypothetical protein